MGQRKDETLSTFSMFSFSSFCPLISLLHFPHIIFQCLVDGLLSLTSAAQFDFLSTIHVSHMCNCITMHFICHILFIILNWFATRN
ncbi:hypothetical protein Lalb_Chr11g0061801 [Lupinus albus]|uniref:Uncharacterized protein n=1 Tax=Lupinus albus TaxID=3870 RepID=A0A6A4PQ77_LUPAL|nr:hypothetical protein Lalb_Chr11g0061801 [Lupinus albus]